MQRMDTRKIEKKGEKADREKGSRVAMWEGEGKSAEDGGNALDGSGE